MSFLDNEEANVGVAIFGGLAIILTLMVFVFGLSPFIDAFSGKMNSKINFEGEPVFPDMARGANNMNTWFYSIMVLFMGAVFVWMFKVTIYEVLYSKQKERKYEDELQGQDY